MKGNPRHPPAAAPKPAPLSPTTKGTAKYTNKDGSKFITVPKASTPTDSAQPSPTVMSTPNAKTVLQAIPGANANGPAAQPVNRKKQKRRAKAAAKAAAEQGVTSEASNGLPSPRASHEQHAVDAEQDLSHDDEEQHADDDSQQHHSHQNGFADSTSAKGKKTKKKKKKSTAGDTDDHSSTHHYQPQHHHHHPHPVSVHTHASGTSPHSQHRSGISKEKIWNTSSQEERERIKEFWLGLSENERKSLVKVEKDAVLKKMKEQQKHTCSCTVCGRKRTAIEEELEGLYDAYYEELEQYANHPNQGEGPPMLRPRPQSFGSMGSMRPRGLPSDHSNHQPSHGRIVEHVGDDVDEEGEEEYSDDELDDDDYSDEEPPEELHRTDYATDFFNFGNSLTVQGRDRLPILPFFLQSYSFSGAVNDAYGSSYLGGILTVADDLLKNDGKKFIEMMEQLAERRMAREEDVRAQFERQHTHANGDRYAGHNHPPPAEEEEYEEEEEEEYEDEEEEEYDSQEEEDTMTEEQRMEEGRRMFQIFAARMFEQRVLTAYREKVAKERQAKLLEEIEDESRQESQRKAKKAKEAQKRKDKAAEKKRQQAEEKARREAEKAAEEAARLAEEARKAEEQRQKAEERRKKKEAQKKAEEEERQRKEAERLRKLHEKEEMERKAREAREREKKAREEVRLKEKEAREQREREARERKEQQEREKREKSERDSKARTAEREAKEKLKEEEKAAQKAAALAAAVPVPITLVKRPAPHSVPAAVPALPQQPATTTTSTTFASPQIAVATPALPKAPTPMRVRQASQQESSALSSGATSQTGSVPSQNPSPHPLTPVHASPGPIGPPQRQGSTSTSTPSIPPQSSLHASPRGTAAKTLPTQPGLSGLFGNMQMPPMGLPFAPQGMPQIPPGFGNSMPRDAGFGPMAGFRSAPGMMAMPPGLNGPMGGRGYPMPPPGFPGPLDSPMPGMAQILGSSLPKESAQSHSRQGSGTFDPTQPIGRPAPIGRPGSVVQQSQRPPGGSPASVFAKPDWDAHLGSSALLDDSDDPLPDFTTRQFRAPPMAGTRQGPAFPTGPFMMDPMFPSPLNPWGSGPVGAPQPNLFAPPPPPGFGPGPMNVPWGPPATAGMSFGGPGLVERPMEPRSVAVRKMLRRACEELADAESKKAAAEGKKSDGFIPLDDIKVQVEIFNHGHPVDEKELLDMTETEGNEINGGGIFDVRQDSSTGNATIRFVSSSGRSDSQPLIHRAVGAPGEIGSPIVGGGCFGSSNR
ncbi:salt tolerance down-regulator-domain-containing protein [Diplogelasinospora grovesii]|uniref:Stress response protein NST1 n=1 Tax=Diplogelasinospora grovesii TaxID=303347 RepID=A0AAN6N1P7_9PEZI|nr:salt tolerance down-regulator-domain-containing protein [Diplogelasinospora grovesii]